MSSEDHDSRNPDPESADPSQPPEAPPGESGAEDEAAANVAAHGEGDAGTASYYDDPYQDEGDTLGESPAPEPDPASGASASGESGAPPPPPGGEAEDEPDEEDDMARMSFLEHLEELRTRILRALGGLLVVYLGCLAFAKDLLRLVLQPFYSAAESIVTPTGEALRIINIRPLEQFQVVYIKVPIVAAVFVGAPWLMYQAWKFIAPGLYRKEKRWAVPFIFTTASLFILGGVFCYFIALPVTLQFLLTVSLDQIEPYISVSDYLNTFIILEIGLGIVFQLPVLIFFFTLLRLTTPRFLLRNVRYAVLIMFVIAAIITPTGDPLTMTLFAGPMILLYFVGIGASWLLVRRREGQKLPWLRIVLALLAFFVLLAAIVAGLYLYGGYRFLPDFPWFGKP